MRAGEWIGLDLFAPFELQGTEFHVVLEDHEAVASFLDLQVSQDAEEWVSMLNFTESTRTS
jgi:hypothetical protein